MIFLLFIYVLFKIFENELEVKHKNHPRTWGFCFFVFFQVQNFKFIQN